MPVKTTPPPKPPKRDLAHGISQMGNIRTTKRVRMSDAASQRSGASEHNTEVKSVIATFHSLDNDEGIGDAFDAALLPGIAVVTPARRVILSSKNRRNDHNPRARRVLFPSNKEHSSAIIPRHIDTDDENDSNKDEHEPSSLQGKSTPRSKRKLCFGRMIFEVGVQENVRVCYGIIRKLTGTIGGNASGGPIYGELTMGSMQRIVNLMKDHTRLGALSRFIDVGSGIGKPSLHVAQDPGVQFSYGIEVDEDRWLLGMNCLRGVLNAASCQPQHFCGDARLGHRCLFDHGDIRAAKTFNPFTHVYMFSIGFPPTLWHDLAKIWNRSNSQYLICYHSPSDVINNYEFCVELITQSPTSMHGSKEGHSAYIYQRCSTARTPMNASGNYSTNNNNCDPLFETARNDVAKGLTSLCSQVNFIVNERIQSGTATRSERSRTRGV